MGLSISKAANPPAIVQGPNLDATSITIDQDQIQVVDQNKNLLDLPNEVLIGILKKLPIRNLLDFKTVSKSAERLADSALFESFPTHAFASIDKMYEFLKAKPSFFSSSSWHFHLYKMVISKKTTKGDIYAIKALLAKPLAERSLQDLVEVGLLNESQRMTVERSAAHASYMTSNAVILDLTQGIEPNFDYLLAVPTDWIADGIIGAFSRLQEPQGENCLMAMVGSRLFIQSRNIGNLGATPLHKAVGLRFLAGINLLLAAKADINMTDGIGNTALHYAALFNYAEAIEYLLARGADPNLRNREGKTALHFAVTKQFVPIARALLAANPNIDLQDKAGWTPLHYAVSSKLPDFVQMLIAAGANLNVQSKKSWTPLHYAVSGGYADLTQTLLAAELDINLQNEVGWTALHMAIFLNRIDLVQILIAISDIDLALQDNAKQTALNLAIALKHIDIVKVLRQPHPDRPSPSLSWSDSLVYYFA